MRGDQPALLRMEKDPPLLQRRIQHFGQIFCFFHYNKAPLRILIVQRTYNILLIDGLGFSFRLFHFAEDFIRLNPAASMKSDS